VATATSGTVAAGGASATLAWSGIAAGSYTIVATYNPAASNPNFNTSTSTTNGTLTVGKADTTTAVTSNPSAVYGQSSSVSLSATVMANSPSAATVGEGTVTFTVKDATNATVGTVTSGTVAAGAATANLSVSSFAVGSYTISAVYNPAASNPNFNTSSSTTNGTLTVNKAATTTGVASSLNPSVFGNSVTFTAAVSVNSPGGGTPTGTVTFWIDGSPLSPITLSGGTAMYTTNALSAGIHRVIADYSGDNNFLTSGGGLSGGQLVNKAPTYVTGVTVTSPRQYSDLVDLSATVASVPPIGGNLSFYINYTSGTSQLLGSVPVAANSTAGITGVALLETVAGSMNPGVHIITALFTPADLTDFTGNSNTTTLTITTEDATVTPDPGNMSAIQVATAGGTAPSFSLVATIREPSDGSLGDITKVTSLTCALSPIGPGSGASVTVPGSNGTLILTTPQSPAGVGGVLTATCNFPAGLAVNVYDLTFTVGSDYYVGAAESTFTVYDPSLGFATGGGWYHWPNDDGSPNPTGDPTNFGFNLKYNKSGSSVQGSVLVIRHRPDGTIVRMKSNSLGQLALSTPTNPNYGWVSITGKGTYFDSLTMTQPVGNQNFLFYSEDWNEPGVGFDKAWIQAVGNPALSGPLSGTQAIPTVISGGNIVVPHSNTKK
jgi:hypothetical protein